MSNAGSSTGSGLNGGFAGDQVQSLMVDVRANTQGFAQDLAAMRGTFNSTVIDGFTQAGLTLQSGLMQALAKGTDGFTALRQSALGVLSDIGQQATSTLFGAVGADAGGNALTGLIGVGSLLGTIMGLPGRATGGPVSPGQPYLVGENGPEMFVPTSAGAINNASQVGGGRDVRVSINVNTPMGSDVPQSLQRSGRQVASAVRRAIGGY